MDEHTVSYLGDTTFHRRYQRFGIRQTDRLSHVYVLGKTGVGKSTLLEALAVQDIWEGRGFALIDPHGDLAERVRDAPRPTRGERLTYLDAADLSQPFGYNPLRRIRDDRIPLAASGFLDALRKLWPDAWGVRMEHVLRNSLFALLERDGSTLPDILRLYWDEAFRKQVTKDIRNGVVRRFWTHEFAKYPDRLKAEAVAPIQNKLGALLTDPRLYRVLVAPEQPVSFRTIMDEGGALVVNLAKGRLGEDGAALLGGLIASTIGLAALSRADSPSDTRRPFFLYIDEFQSFTTLSFVNMLAELRKYGVGLTLAHQHLHQLDTEVRHAVLGNVGTTISFRVGPEDADVMAKEFQPTFNVLDLINLPNQNFYLKLMIDGAPSRPFSARIAPWA
ncbi:type IV secretory system conjugative DNA transfer family protein [Brevundimonas sp.]|uniref:type IV secretory system conjugative DNA transfer family protein n=1 Tax=Brevundimonas sp. TaxID=1871086 RepID=UPI002E14B45C|nr:type IV secretion system DNA-binding domain-containing protein [Brevundimonas sp.]